MAPSRRSEQRKEATSEKADEGGMVVPRENRQRMLEKFKL